MRLVEYIDENGWLKCSLIKDDMLESEAHLGIPKNPPDLLQLDCGEILKELNNLIVKRGLFTLADVNKSNGALDNAIRAVLQRRIIALYKEHHSSGLEKGEPPSKKARKTT